MLSSELSAPTTVERPSPIDLHRQPNRAH